jgi:thiosulfate dehydrogenase [quinone] large subunit
VAPQEFVNQRGEVTIADPPIARMLFGSTKLAWLWLIIRLYLGYQWITAGYHKITGGGWLDGGAALKGFWANAVQVPPQGKAPIAFDWYRGFIQFLLDTGSYTWFAKLVVFGEMAVGIALIVGAFVGVAAAFGALMNWNFIMAGSASTNGLLLALALLLVLAWKVAGWYGLDRYLLPMIGVPWNPNPAPKSTPATPAPTAV